MEVKRQQELEEMGAFQQSEEGLEGIEGLERVEDVQEAEEEQPPEEEDSGSEREFYEEVWFDGVFCSIASIHFKILFASQDNTHCFSLGNNQSPD